MHDCDAVFSHRDNNEEITILPTTQETFIIKRTLIATLYCKKSGNQVSNTFVSSILNILYIIIILLLCYYNILFKYI